MRTYEKTHPWLSFTIDVDRFPPRLWMLLGEAVSKVEHLAGVPLRPQTAVDLNRLFLAKGVLATTAIEGNTLSEEQVLQHLEGALQVPPSKEYLKREVDNIVAACNAIWEDDPEPLSPETLKRFNARVLEGLEGEEGVVPGQIRRHSAGVPGYRGAPWEDCDYLLDRLCEWLETLREGVGEGTVWLALIRAVLAHVYVEWIHPFGDGNGRVGRLVELQILVTAGVPISAAHLLSNHYNETRSQYYRQLRAASASGGDVVPFLVYAVQGFVDGLRNQLALVRAQQLDVVWRNFVHETFRGRETDAKVRQRDLVLALSRQSKPVRRKDLPLLDRRLARRYSKKTEKTLTRDVKTLKTMGLIRQVDGGYVACKERIMAFMPRRTNADAC